MNKKKVVILGAVMCCCTALVLAVTTPPVLNGPPTKSHAESIQAAQAAEAQLESGGVGTTGQGVVRTASLPDCSATHEELQAAQTRAAYALPDDVSLTASRVPPAKHIDSDVPLAEEGGRATGDDCSDPLIISLPAALPYTDANQTTCGRGNNYVDTCLGSYDGGEDIIYQIDVTADVTVDITVTSNTTEAWLGVAIDSVCPPGNPCIAFDTSSSGTVAQLDQVVLTVGTYYMMVDTWPTPNCLSNFTLLIEEYVDPCPPGSEPANDDCVNATPVAGPYPQVVTGDNTCATIDCPGVLDWYATWFAIDLPYTANDLYVDYCGSPQEIYSIGVIAYATCPSDPNECAAYILRDNFSFTTCPDTLTNPQVWWTNLPGPGTIYLPVSAELADGTPLPYQATINVTEYIPSYCEPCFTNLTDEIITNVTIGTINNDTVGEGAPCSYGDYTALYTKVYRGFNYPISVTFDSGTYTECVQVWIDWNQNLDFEDDPVNEYYYLGSGASTTLTGTIDVPVGALLGSTRMRVMVDYSTCQNSCNNPASLYGETEDYTIVVEDAPPFGACCVGPVCTLTDEDDCVNNLLGIYKGNGTNCDPNPCVGACCYTDGNCAITTEADCLPPNIFQGDATDCDPSPCPQPGACCFMDGHCEQSTVVDPGDCAPGGIYLGDDTLCVPPDPNDPNDPGINPCPQPCVCDVTVGSFCENFDTETDPNSVPPILGWTNDPAAELAWLWNSGGTPSSSTGPPGDHTTGSGYYMYTESSGNYNKTAILNGPCVDLTGMTNPTLRFWYHMYGATMGTLRVQVSDNYCITWDTVFDMSGDQGNQWYLFEYDLSAYSGIIQIRFYGITGTSYTSDMAIDDVCVVEPGLGACCVGPACTVTSEDDCINTLLGVYQGDFTNCDPNPCVGACCYPDGSCALTTEADCLPPNVFQGGATDCDPNPCPQPGACCYPDGTCGMSTVVDPGDCAPGGVYVGDDSSCDPNPCPPLNDLCGDAIDILAVPFTDLDINYGLATPDIDISCNSTSCTETRFGVWYTYTPAEDCDATLFVEGTTAFQDIAQAIFTGPDCNNLTEVACSDPETLTYSMTGGVKYWILIGRWSCTSIPTSNIDFTFTCSRGACCVGDVCTQESPTSCAAISGVYVGDGVPCDPNPCVTGACCFLDGSCQVTDLAGCDLLGGSYLGNGTVCDPNPCPQPGDTCDNPLTIELPLELDYTDASQYTCGRVNDYADTCLGSYDGGEDIIYEVTVTDPVCVDITATGADSTNNWLGVGIDNVCPLGNPCIAAATSSGTVATISGLVLVPGTYYVMVDTWPSPTCLTDFTLTITASTACAQGACCDLALGCYETYPEVCVYNGGTFMGVGTTCDPTDCQPNGTFDMCDIALGLSEDCQPNGVPDECDIAAGTSLDVDLNGVPDECDLDCNENGIPDGCELPGGCATGDCGTVYPTDCGTGDDCQPDGILDECQLGGSGGPPLEYSLDDGTGEDSLGIPAGADLVEIVSHTVTGGAGTIESVSVAWGNVDAGYPAAVYVWSDPTQDGNPADAVLLATAPTVTQNVDTDTFNVVMLPAPVSVGGDGTIFFIGVWCQTPSSPPNPYALRMDETEPVSGRNWIIGDVNYAWDPTDLGNAAYSTPLGLIEGLGFPCNFMVRASGLTGMGADCNNNGIPDECDVPPICMDPPPLCSADCNGNLIPDECEVAEEDCNGNGVPDDCDVDPTDPDGDGWVSPDCQPNGIPDECEADCNANGIPDDCDIRDCDGSPWCSDCNGNAIPDGCDIDPADPDGNGEVSEDCQPDLIPDECQLWKKGDKAIVLTEGWEEGIIPPTGWTHIQTNPTETWEITSFNPYEGVNSTVCYYDPAFIDQDEWQISPSLTMSGTVTLSGWTQGNLYWGGGAPYDNYDLEAWVVIGPDVNDGDDIYIGKLDDSWPATWVWGQFSFPFTAPTSNFRIGLRYVGNDGAQGNIDALQVDGEAGAPSNDCNRNGVPDECDIDPAFGGLCDPNVAVCDTDWNYNGVPDDCEFCGDLTGDGFVTYEDFQAFLATYRLCDGDTGYNPDADFDGDMCITLVDYQRWLMCYRMANGHPFNERIVPLDNDDVQDVKHRVRVQTAVH